MEDNKELTMMETNEPEIVEEDEVVQSNSGALLLIGAALGAGAYVLVKKAYKWWKDRKAKEPTVNATDPNVIDITPDPVDSDEEETE